MAVWKYRREFIPPVDSVSGEHPVIEALFEIRGVGTPEERSHFLRPDFSRDTHDPFLFAQMERVVERLIQALQVGEAIGIFGDYDADGVTSSVIMREALIELGFDVRVYIPHKTTEGHGLHTNALDAFALDGVTLMLTLDCGMTNHTEIEEANHRGMDVIVVDHHHTPEILPDAFAIINPKMLAETYPFKELCGAGTTFKVAQALFARLAPERTEWLKWLLDVVATGTVADVMPLVGENRVLVKYGLIVLSKTRRIGFQEMFAVGKLNINEGNIPDAHMIGFQIAPRINAASRMAHARLAHDLLMSRDRVEARELALELEAKNVERRKQSEYIAGVVSKLAREKFSEKKFIFAVDEGYPLGIAGLIAGRIANEFHKPTAVLCRGETESVGSFRSIPELNIIETLTQCADLVEKFGGHSQAAGMTIRNENLDIFYERFNGLVEKQLHDVVTEPELWIDTRLLGGHLTLPFLDAVNLLAPFGEGNREPVFALEGVEIVEKRSVGKDGKHIKLTIRPDGAVGNTTFDVIGFSFGERLADVVAGDFLDIAFNVNGNDWNGSRRLQLKLVDIRHAAKAV